MRHLLPAIALLLVPTAMSAHPDHSAGAPVRLLHFLTDPFHLSIVAAGAFVLASVFLVLRRHRSARTH